MAWISPHSSAALQPIVGLRSKSRHDSPPPPRSYVLNILVSLASDANRTREHHAASRSLAFDREAAGGEARDLPLRKMGNC